MRVLLSLIAAAAAVCAVSGRPAVSETLEISKVPSEFPVGFSLLTTPDRQYAAYYDADRHMTVAARSLDSAAWVYQILPSQIVWDSHNYITMALDSAGDTYNHKDYGAGSLSFDARELVSLDKPAPAISGLPRTLGNIESDFPGMEIRRANDAGSCGTPGVRYLLQWETLGPHHDRPRQPPVPAPSTLRLYKLTGAPDTQIDPE